MIYVFIDESGDVGDPNNKVNSRDFSMAACIAYSENIEYLSNQIKESIFRAKKKEFKFSKMSENEVKKLKSFLTKLDIEYVMIYKSKTSYHFGQSLLKQVFEELINSLNIYKGEKIKVFVDGIENAYYRKIYEKILRKNFTHVVLRFANSQKTPMIQVADFYAGYCRRKNNQYDRN